jgi:pSer/pThr/pTyr-binding forkhead associated (FHA) protein
VAPEERKTPAEKAAPEPREATRLESDEEIRQAIQARSGQAAARNAKGKPVPPSVQEAISERPFERPPMALLCVLDDDKADGEWTRLRADRYILGRGDADVRIPHDHLISGRHAELARQRTADGFRWHLIDLRSTNGTFVRISSSILRDGMELLIGAARFRFEAGEREVRRDVGEPDQNQAAATQSWSADPLNALVPSLVEITPAGPVQRFPLVLPEYWIGRDAANCAIVRHDDLLASPRHARLYRDVDRRWHVENNKSLNGTWFRVTEPMPLGKACRFRLGE